MNITVNIDYFYTLLAIFSGISLTGAIFAIILSLISYAKITGMEKATHSVQYIPIDTEFDRQNEDFLKDSQTDADWATSEESIAAEDKKYRKEMDEAMPEFSQEEDDMKIHSF